MTKILVEGMSCMMGGLETFIHTLFQYMDASRYHFDFLVYDLHIPFEEEFEEAGCKIYRVTPRSKNPLQYRRELDEIFRKGNYEVFWSNRTTLSSIQPFKSAKKYGVPIIVCHSHQSKNMGTLFTLVMHKLHQGSVKRFITKKAACSDVAAKWFFGKDKDVVILKNSVDTALYDYSPKKARQLKEDSHLEQKFVIGHIGRFAPEKNHTFLIEIFEKVLETEKNAVLLLCGDGEKRRETEELVRQKNLTDKVEFLGIRNDVIDLLHLFDVMVFPSIFEGLPFVLVEAQAAGLPCIVSDQVSGQAKLTDCLEFVNLDKGAGYWAGKVLEYRGKERKSCREQMEESGFGISDLLEQIYTQILKK